MRALARRLVVLIAALALLVPSLYYGAAKPKEAKAQVINYTVGDMQRWIEFFQLEAQEVTVDQIRQIVIKEVTKKMIEKIIGGEQGGVAGGGSAFISDYTQFLYHEPEDDVRSFIDDEFDRQFPSYIDPAIKEGLKSAYDPSARYIAEDCVDVNSINFRSDTDAINKLMKSLQPGCNEITAQVILAQRAEQYGLAMVQQAMVEAQANKGLVSKDERSNDLDQSGVVLEGIIQGALSAVYGVQINNESAISSVIGAFVDQLLDELLDEQF